MSFPETRKRKFTEFTTVSDFDTRKSNHDSEYDEFLQEPIFRKRQKIDEKEELKILAARKDYLVRLGPQQGSFMEIKMQFDKFDLVEYFLIWFSARDSISKITYLSNRKGGEYSCNFHTLEEKKIVPIQQDPIQVVQVLYRVFVLYSFTDRARFLYDALEKLPFPIVCREPFLYKLYSIDKPIKLETIGDFFKAVNEVRDMDKPDIPKAYGGEGGCFMPTYFKNLQGVYDIYSTYSKALTDEKIKLLQEKCKSQTVYIQ